VASSAPSSSEDPFWSPADQRAAATDSEILKPIVLSSHKENPFADPELAAPNGGSRLSNVSYTSYDQRISQLNGPMGTAM